MRWLGLLATLAVLTAPGGLASPGMAQTASPAPLPTLAVVSRERLLRETEATRALRDAETRMTAQLQSSIDEAQERLAAEEAELALLRDQMGAEAFEARAADFDARIRTLRRRTQDRVTLLETGFQQARAIIVAALPPLLERLRTETGVSVILNADQALAFGPALDLTDRAIALFDAAGPRPQPPDVDLVSPLVPPPAPGETAAPPGGQDGDGQ